MALTIEGVTLPVTGSSGNTPVDNGSGGNGGLLDTLINNAGDIFSGAGSLVNAFKGNPNTQTTVIQPAVQPRGLGAINPMYIVLAILAVIVLLVLMFKR